MRIGIESGAYLKKYGLKEGLERMKRHGYDCLDYQFLADTETELYRCGEPEFERRLNEIKEAAQQAGVEIVQTHGPWRWPPRDRTPEERAERFEKMEKSIRATRLLGVKYVIIHPIMPYGDGAQEDNAEFWAINFDFYGRLTKVAEREDVIICLENMPMPELPMARPAEILDFVRKIDRPNLRVCLDTGHCAVCGVSPADATRELGKEYLCTIHAHDNQGDRDYHLLPGEGIIDWPAFADALREIGYEGAFCLETAVKGEMPAEECERRERALADFVRQLVRG